MSTNQLLLLKTWSLISLPLNVGCLLSSVTYFWHIEYGGSDGCDPGLILKDVVLLPCSLLDPPISGKNTKVGNEWKNVDFGSCAVY